MADEFLNALQGLGKSVQQWGFGAAVQQANERMQQIKNELKPGMEQRAQLTSLADDLYMRLVAGGQNPQEALLARNVLIPQTPNSAADAVLKGTMLGDSAMAEAGRSMLQEEENRKLQSINAQADRNFQLQSMLEAGRDRRAQAADQAKAQFAAKNKIIPISEAEKLSAIDESKANLNGILSQLERMKSAVGPTKGVLSSLPFSQWAQNPESAAFRAEIGRTFDKYRKDITGAGASATELKTLQANAISASDTAEVLRAKIKNLLLSGERTKAVRLDTFKKTGYDTSGFATPQAGTVTLDPYQASPTAGGLQLQSFVESD